MHEDSEPTDLNQCVDKIVFKESPCALDILQVCILIERLYQEIQESIQEKEEEEKEREKEKEKEEHKQSYLYPEERFPYQTDLTRQFAECPLPYQLRKEPTLALFPSNGEVALQPLKLLQTDSLQDSLEANRISAFSVYKREKSVMNEYNQLKAKNF